MLIGGSVLALVVIGGYQLTNKNESTTAESSATRTENNRAKSESASDNANTAGNTAGNTATSKPVNAQADSATPTNTGSSTPAKPTTKGSLDAGTEAQAPVANNGAASKNNADQAPNTAGTVPSPNEEDQDMKPAKTRFPLDRTGIPQAVQSVVPDIKDCYQEWVKLNPGIGGAMMVQITVTTDPEDTSKGKVTGAEIVKSEVKNKLIDGCVLNALSELEFEAPPDGTVSFAYPFRFSAPDAGVLIDAGN